MIGSHASFASLPPFRGWSITVHPHPGNSEDDDDDVNGWITLGFALGNMLFDFICLLNFFKSHKQTGRDSMLPVIAPFYTIVCIFGRMCRQIDGYILESRVNKC